MSIKGKARVDKRTKDLVKRLRKNEIAVISHEDIDEVAANSLIEKKPAAIINSCCSISGRYPAKGVYKLLKAGIPVFDEAGEQIFSRVKDGTPHRN
jgi:uncharacterized membrane-anchored protein